MGQKSVNSGQATSTGEQSAQPLAGPDDDVVTVVVRHGFIRCGDAQYFPIQHGAVCECHGEAGSDSRDITHWARPNSARDLSMFNHSNFGHGFLVLKRSWTPETGSAPVTLPPQLTSEACAAACCSNHAKGRFPRNGFRALSRARPGGENVEAVRESS